MTGMKSEIRVGNLLRGDPSEGGLHVSGQLFEVERPQPHRGTPPTVNDRAATSPRVTLLTGGGDRPYALGMTSALADQGINVDFIGSDELDAPELRRTPLVTFLNLRGDQTVDAPLRRKVVRILAYYARLIKYVLRSEPPIFHILWNNKFELIDRTLVMLYYKMMGKRVVLTAHNVNARKRDTRDSFLNRLSLRIQYKLSDHIFAHTEKMKTELVSEFGVCKDKVSIIPFGINNTVPNATLSIAEAKRQLKINQCDKTLLFFGNIAPYKGLEYLIAAFSTLLRHDYNYRLIIAGRPKGNDNYWKQIQQAISRGGMQERIIQRIEYVPDEQTGLYFKAADVLVLPYTRIFQSGVLFLGYAFGLPAIATDVGSLRDDIIEGKTGCVCRARDASDLVRAIKNYFASDLYQNLDTRRSEIREFANQRNSWTKVGEILERVYRSVLAK
jgi:glycosyltransferase involved in cell wall biosynthesis